MTGPSRKDRLAEPPAELPGLERRRERPTPEQIIAAAELDANGPVVRRYCLFSGGKDSTVTAHRCRDHYDELAFIDTGTALPGVREHVQTVAELFGKPLTILEARNAYRTLVLGSPEWWEHYRRSRRPGETPVAFILRNRGSRKPGDGLGDAPLGFPPPAGHKQAYARLKERQVETLVREAKARYGGQRRDARVMLITGARRLESARRMKTQAGGDWRRNGGQLWVNPLNEWSTPELRAYHAEHDLPVSDVTALTHRSGECNCGAYATREEREELRAWYREWWDATIAPLEAEAERLGIPRCKWGERSDTGRVGARGAYEAAIAGTGELCSSCDIQQLRLANELG